MTFLRRFQTIFKKLKVIHSSPMATAINLVYLKLSFAFEIGITIYGSRQFQLFLNENCHEVFDFCTYVLQPYTKCIILLLSMRNATEKR